MASLTDPFMDSAMVMDDGHMAHGTSHAVLHGRRCRPRARPWSTMVDHGPGHGRPWFTAGQFMVDHGFDHDGVHGLSN